MLVVGLHYRLRCLVFLRALKDTMVLKAIQSGELEAVETALKNVDETLAARDLGDATLVMRAAETGCDQIFSVILDAMLEKMSAQQVRHIDNRIVAYHKREDVLRAYFCEGVAQTGRCCD